MPDREQIKNAGVLFIVAVVAIIAAYLFGRASGGERSSLVLKWRLGLVY